MALPEVPDGTVQVRVNREELVQSEGPHRLHDELRRPREHEVAVALAEAGADIAIADVEQISSPTQQYGTAAVGGFTAVQTTVAEISDLGRRAIAIQADINEKN